MSEVVIVDWLGRGGIAQCSVEWLRAGSDAVLWTRSGREISGPSVTSFAVKGSGLRAHIGLVQQMARALRQARPRAVVIQNFLVPPIDRIVHEAARRAGASVVFVVHDHRLHSLAAGTQLGLTGLLRSADVVAAHSHFVAEALRRLGVRSPDVLPLPIHHAVVDAPPGEPVVDVPSGRLLALHFGVVKRRYKGADVLRGLARMAGGGLWSFASVGVGATASENLAAVDRFLGPGDLMATIASADAIVLPYRFATQSGAVALGQAAGKAVIASAVGGIPEQINEGRTGFLVPAGAGMSVWHRVLSTLEDETLRLRVGEAARAAAREADRQFIARASSMLS